MADEELETWENVTHGRISILKKGEFGRLVGELIGPKRKFTLTKADRQLNQDRAATEEQDIFQNGTLSPVRLIDGDEDAAMFASNPNMLGDSELADLYKVKQWKAFESKVGEISNLMTLQRLLSMAGEEATVRQVKAIEDRIAELSPAQEPDGPGPALGRDGKPIGVTPF